jgi:uncharacterized protein DUF973
MRVSVATPLPSPSRYPVAPPPRPAGWSSPSTPWQPGEAAALSSVKVAGIIGIVGAILGWVVIVFNATTSITSTAVTKDASGTPHLNISTSTIEFLLLIAGLAVLLEIVQLLYFLSAFRQLRQYDGSFQTPGTLLWLALIGLPLLFLALGLLLNSVIALANCVNVLPAGASANSFCSSQLAAAGELAIFLLLAAILALIGWVALLIGVWRLGDHFPNSHFHAAAILLIIPFLSVVGFILIWYSSRRLSTATSRVTLHYL